MATKTQQSHLEANALWAVLEDRAAADKLSALPLIQKDVTWDQFVLREIPFGKVHGHQVREVDVAVKDIGDPQIRADVVPVMNTRLPLLTQLNVASLAYSLDLPVRWISIH